MSLQMVVFLHRKTKIYQSMNEPQRLFDLLDRKKQLTPERAVFVRKENGEWKKHFIDEYIEKSTLISYALLHLGVKRGENVALISAGRPEWNYVDMGVQMMGGVLVPIYPTISEEDYLYILEKAEVRYIIVENETLLKRFPVFAPSFLISKKFIRLTRLRGIRLWRIC